MHMYVFCSQNSNVRMEPSFLAHESLHVGFLCVAYNLRGRTPVIQT